MIDRLLKLSKLNVVNMEEKKQLQKDVQLFIQYLEKLDDISLASDVLYENILEKMLRNNKEKKHSPILSKRFLLK